MATLPRSAFRLAGASILALAALASPALAQKGPESAAQNYEIFHSHVAWRASAVVASNAAQTGTTWKVYGSHVARSNDANWLPTMLPGETVNVPGRVDRSNEAIDLRP
jgi:hypothetical protein